MIYGEGPYADALRKYVDHEPHAWIAQQTAVDVDGKPRFDEAFDYARLVCASLSAGTLVILSTQLPIGSCAALERTYPKLRFVVQPENVRAAHALEDFRHQDRMIVGTRAGAYGVMQGMLAPFTERLLFMSPESAEMSKHALNGFLALCIRYGNEIGRLCELWNANPDDVVAALRSDRRIGDVPIIPGDPPSKHLLREVHALIQLGGGQLIGALL